MFEHRIFKQTVYKIGRINIQVFLISTVKLTIPDREWNRQE